MGWCRNRLTALRRVSRVASRWRKFLTAAYSGALGRRIKQALARSGDYSAAEDLRDRISVTASVPICTCRRAIQPAGYGNTGRRL